MKRSFFSSAIAFSALVLLASGCAKTRSNSTGMSYNDRKNGGFQINLKYKGQETGPGLVFIEGGTFIMGRVEEDVIKDWNNQPRRVTVASFYLDENEVTNADYREYLYWLRRVYDYDYYPQIYQSALPDTLVWRDKMGLNDMYVENYLRHPAYNFYPVVGVNWEQAMRFCQWRTDRVNEQILIDKGILNVMNTQADDQNFNSEVYPTSKENTPSRTARALRTLALHKYLAKKDVRPASKTASCFRSTASQPKQNGSTQPTQKLASACTTAKSTATSTRGMALQCATATRKFRATCSRTTS